MLKPRHLREWKQARRFYDVQRSWSNVKDHDRFVVWKWSMRKLYRLGLKDKAHIRITQADGSKVEYKASKRGYGVKWVSWEPFEVFKHISNLDIIQFARTVEVLYQGEGEEIFEPEYRPKTQSREVTKIIGTVDSH